MSRSSSASSPPSAEGAGGPAPGRFDLVGLIPAAGSASRLGGPATSKEVLPVGRSGRPAASFLLRRMAQAGIGRAYMVIRPEKWDIPRTLGDGAAEGVRLAYLAVGATASVCETLDRAVPFVGDRAVAVGFPDVLFEPADAFARIVRRWRSGGADAVLALVPTDRPDKADVVETDAGGRVTRIEIKPPGGGRGTTWVGAVWTPAVTALLHEMVAGGYAGEGGELYPGDVLREAVARGMRVEGVEMPEGRHLDVGTPEDLDRARDWP